MGGEGGFEIRGRGVASGAAWEEEEWEENTTAMTIANTAKKVIFAYRLFRPGFIDNGALANILKK